MKISELKAAKNVAGRKETFSITVDGAKASSSNFPFITAGPQLWKWNQLYREKFRPKPADDKDKEFEFQILLGGE